MLSEHLRFITPSLCGTESSLWPLQDMVISTLTFIIQKEGDQIFEKIIS